MWTPSQTSALCGPALLVPSNQSTFLINCIQIRHRLLCLRKRPLFTSPFAHTHTHTRTHTEGSACPESGAISAFILLLSSRSPSSKRCSIPLFEHFSEGSTQQLTSSWLSLFPPPYIGAGLSIWHHLFSILEYMEGCLLHKDLECLREIVLYDKVSLWGADKTGSSARNSCSTLQIRPCQPTLSLSLSLSLFLSFLFSLFLSHHSFWRSLRGVELLSATPPGHLERLQMCFFGAADRRISGWSSVRPTLVHFIYNQSAFRTQSENQCVPPPHTLSLSLSGLWH